MRLLLSVLFGHRLYKIVSRLDQEQLIEDEGGYPFVGVGHGSSSSHARVAISARKVSPLVAPQAGNGCSLILCHFPRGSLSGRQ